MGRCVGAKEDPATGPIAAGLREGGGSPGREFRYQEASGKMSNAGGLGEKRQRICTEHHCDEPQHDGFGICALVQCELHGRYPSQIQALSGAAIEPAPVNDADYAARCSATWATSARL